jgi:hypothetical protein
VERHARGVRTVERHARGRAYRGAARQRACVPLSLKQRVGVYVYAFPITFGIRD